MPQTRAISCMNTLEFHKHCFFFPSMEDFLSPPIATAFICSTSSVFARLLSSGVLTNLSSKFPFFLTPFCQHLKYWCFSGFQEIFIPHIPLNICPFFAFSYCPTYHLNSCLNLVSWIPHLPNTHLFTEIWIWSPSF